jgi:hypothetical protein
VILPASPIHYRNWILQADAAATIAAYQDVRSPTSYCTCHWCRNFMAWREGGYPADVLEVLSRCGLDPFRESDVYQQDLRPDEGTVLYRWFFFFRGRILSGPQAWIFTEDDPDPVLPITKWDLQLVDLSAPPCYVAIGFADSPSRIEAEGQNVPRTLQHGPTVQVELRAHVPWTVSEAMPNRL